MTEATTNQRKQRRAKATPATPSLPTITFADLEAQLRRVPVDRLGAVYNYLTSMTKYTASAEDEEFNGLLLSREVLAREWDSPEDDEAFGSYEQR